MSSRTHLHCIFVHGFRGDHTSFQRFPSDIDKSLRSKLPDRFEVSSYLYPTYPSVRPIAFAVQQFLAWSVWPQSRIDTVLTFAQAR